MQAWGAAGVNMPHYSGAQYSMFPHVPLNAMQPGDLVFWGPGGSEHVGLYIGGGPMIAAPSTGDVVKIPAVWGSPPGAAPPRWARRGTVGDRPPRRARGAHPRPRDALRPPGRPTPAF